MEIPINKVAGPDNPNPAIHMVTQGHDIEINSSGLRFGLDFLGMACHGDCHSHVDALCHISYKGQTYNGRPALEVLTTKGATTLDIANYGTGLVGRGVLLDLPRFRGVKWLEPGEAVTRAELEACERAQGVELGEGDVFVYRTGHHRRRLELGAWDNGYPPGEGKAGLHVDTIPWMHERRIAAFLPDGDGEAVPSRSRGCCTRSTRCRSSPWACSARTASSSRTSPRPARRKAALSSWSSGCRSASRAGPVRPGTRSPSSRRECRRRSLRLNARWERQETGQPGPVREGGRSPTNDQEIPATRAMSRVRVEELLMTVETATGTTVATTNLKPGALRLPSIFMQSLTMVAPGIAALFYTPVVVAQAGLAAPLAYPIAFVIVLLTAIVLAQLARAVPGAGGYYNYVSRGINPSAGFLVSWLNIIYAPLVLGAVTVFGGYVISSSLEWTGAAADWFPLGFGFVVVTIVAIIQYMGVQLSGKTLVITGGIELILVFLLGLWGLANPGPGGLNLQPFNPATPRASRACSSPPCSPSRRSPAGKARRRWPRSPRTRRGTCRARSSARWSCSASSS